MPRRRASPRLGPPLGDKYVLRQRCRHGKYKTDRIELGYAVPGNVCRGCLADHPAVAMLNTAQVRQLRPVIEHVGITTTPTWHLGPVIGPAMSAMQRADDLCTRVRRVRPMKVQGHKAGVLMVCSCLEARIMDVTLACWTPGDACGGCGKRLPSVCWLREDESGAFVEEMPTIIGHRRALSSAQGPAPVVDYPEG